MKVEKADYIWAVVSVLTISTCYTKGVLLNGILIAYGLMVALFVYHIFKVKKMLEKTVAVYGTVTEIREKKDVRTYYYPVVEYQTEDGRDVSSVYTYPDRKKRYEPGDEEMICYDPENPVFFYFANRENELTNEYYRYILFGGIPALCMFLAILFK